MNKKFLILLALASSFPLFAPSTNHNGRLAIQEEEAAVQEFLDFYGFEDINALNDAGTYPLHQALRTFRQNQTIAYNLIAHGADVNAVEPDTGMTPLMVAARKRLLDVAEKLIAEGASTTVRDNNNMTVMDWAEGNPAMETLIDENTRN